MKKITVLEHSFAVEGHEFPQGYWAIAEVIFDCCDLGDCTTGILWVDHGGC